MCYKIFNYDKKTSVFILFITSIALLLHFSDNTTH